MSNQESSTYVSLQGLTRQSRVSGSRSCSIDDAIEAMKCACDAMLAKQPEGMEAMTQRMITRLQEIVKLHCIACLRANSDTENLFTNAQQWHEKRETNNPLPVIVEQYLTEALQCSLAITGVVGGKPNKGREAAVAKLAAYHGDDFAEYFFQGDAIKLALEEVGIIMTDEEIQEVFSRRVRLYLAVNNIAKPLEAVRKVGKNVHEELTDEKIAAALEEEGITPHN